MVAINKTYRVAKKVSCWTVQQLTFFEPPCSSK